MGEIYFAAKLPVMCPACASQRMAEILYGLPSERVIPELQAGRVVLGGCCLTGTDPSWQCMDCRTLVYRTALRRRYIERPEDFRSSAEGELWDDE